MNDISKLQFEVNFINNKTIKDIVEYMLKHKSPKYFWSVGSSSTGYFHPTNNGQPITLVDHTKSATRILRLLLTHPMVAGQIDGLKADLMTAAIIVHDLAKRGATDEGASEYTVHEHPVLISLMAPPDMTSEQQYYFSEIVRLACSHTGPWRFSERSTYVLPEIEQYDQYLVHLADWLSSRKIFHVDLEDDTNLISYLSQR